MIDKKTKRFKPAPALSCESKSGGSALIMTIVLTSLLAIVAVMFVAVARMDRASTSNIADNKTLDLAAKSIAEIISRELINDTPGVRSGEEYYDYPDPCNAWLASIEPYKSGTDYYWRQISDVTGCLKNEGFDTNDVDVNVPGGRKTVDEYPDITLTGGKLDELWADADGDGIADSKWFELKDLYSSKGKAIYAAVRVIDNGGMVNINTAHSFNPDSGDITKINGSTQMQINLRGLLKGTPAQVSTQMTDFNEARCSGSSEAWPDYERNVIWDYNTVPGGGYLPFDISDELELRYRYCIDSKFIGRVESNTPPRVLPVTLRSRGVLNFGHLYRDSVSNWGLADWQERITEPNNLYADRRHMLTTVNYDRVIDPNGDKMTNINDANANSLYASIRKGILDANSNFPDVNEVSAQIAVNIIDYRDGDSNVTVFSVNDVNYYGFETPCAYISELACRVGTDVNDPNRSYAIELFKPYDDIDPNNSWNVVIDTGATTTIPISDWSGTNSRYYVIRWNNTFVPLDDVNGAPGQSTDTTTDYTIIFDANSKISLTRNVNGADIVVDSVEIPPGWSPAPSPVADSNHCIRRDIRTNKCIMRLWDLTDSNKVTLGKFNDYNSPDANMIQAHPKNGDFTNIGEIGMIFRKPAFYEFGDPCTNVIGYDDPNKLESAVRLNLADPNFQQIFNYLTVMDPHKYGHPDNETRIKGRININTAPAFVIAQLPWVAHRKNYDSNDLAKAIVAYRDKMKESESDPNYDYEDRDGAAGFETIGQLCDVNDGADPNFGIDYYSRKDGPEVGDQLEYPDLDPNDNAADDFQERDLIFARISDLVTVRSDVFTAYILVRVCTSVNEDDEVEGPQKRYMVIFDRSGVKSSTDRVKIIAFQSVPEAR